MEAGRIACTALGGPLLFGRSGSGSGIAEVLGELLVSGGFEFARQRPASAVCAGLRSQLREMDERLPDRGDHRAVAAPPRAMAWLHQGSARGAFVRARRDLFSDLSLVSMYTTSCRSTANTMASPSNGPTCCAISTVSRRQPSRRTASVTPAPPCRPSRQSLPGRWHRDAA